MASFSALANPLADLLDSVWVLLGPGELLLSFVFEEALEVLSSCPFSPRLPAGCLDLLPTWLLEEGLRVSREEGLPRGVRVNREEVSLQSKTALAKHLKARIAILLAVQPSSWLIGQGVRERARASQKHFCDICESSLQSKTALAKHLKSKAHLEKVRLAAGGTPKPSLRGRSMHGSLLRRIGQTRSTTARSARRRSVSRAISTSTSRRPHIWQKWPRPAPSHPLSFSLFSNFSNFFESRLPSSIFKLLLTSIDF